MFSVHRFDFLKGLAWEKNYYQSTIIIRRMIWTPFWFMTRYIILMQLQDIQIDNKLSRIAIRLRRADNYDRSSLEWEYTMSSENG